MTRTRTVAVALAAIFSLTVALGPTLAQSLGFVEPFDGDPPAPQTYDNPDLWDVSLVGNFYPLLADHSSACGAPPAQHMISNLADMIFMCNGHIMTSIFGSYGAAYLTPPAMLDISSGSSVLRWDMSTKRTSARDWVDVVIMPFNGNHALSFEDRHVPTNAVHLDLAGGGNVFVPTQIVDGQTMPIPGDTFTTWNTILAKEGLAPDAARRDTFEVTLSKTRLKLCMPHYGFCWFDSPLPQPLSQDAYVVQLNHRSYNPEKACAGWNGAPSTASDERYPGVISNDWGDANCPPNTWHWDNVSIQPAAALTIIPGVPVGQVRHWTNAVNQNTADPTFTFDPPAPAGSFLRFIGWAANPQFSLDGGSTWKTPTAQLEAAPLNPEVSDSYFDAVPQGTTSIKFRASGAVNGQWEIHNVALWARGGALPVATPHAVPSSTPTAAASTATATPTATAPAADVTSTPTPAVQPAATETPAPASTATTAPTATATATSANTSTPVPAPTSTATPPPPPAQPTATPRPHPPHPTHPGRPHF